jgi:hypothetical protein
MAVDVIVAVIVSAPVIVAALLDGNDERFPSDALDRRVKPCRVGRPEGKRRVEQARSGGRDDVPVNLWAFRGVGRWNTCFVDRVSGRVHRGSGARSWVHGRCSRSLSRDWEGDRLRSFERKAKRCCRHEHRVHA